MLALREAETLPAIRDALALVAHLPMPSLPPPVAIEVTAARERMWALEEENRRLKERRKAGQRTLQEAGLDG